MKYNVVDRISLILIVLFIITLGYISVEWYKNAFQEHKDWVYSADASGNGIIATASGNQIYLWENGYCIDSLIGHKDAIKSISFSNDNNYIASGSIDNTIKVWSIENRQAISTFSNHTAGVNNVEFSYSDKYIISAGYDKKLMIWEWQNNKKIKNFDIDHTKFSVNKFDEIAFQDTGCNITLFNIQSSVKRTLEGLCGLPSFHPAGEILAVKTEDGNIQVINSKNGDLCNKLNIHNSDRLGGSFAFTPDGNHIIVGESIGEINIWDWKDNKILNTIYGVSFGIYADFAFIDVNKIVTASRSTEIWNLQTGKMEGYFGTRLYKSKIQGIISIIVIIVLTFGFLGLFTNDQNRYSNWAIITILSIWSVGVLTLSLSLRRYLLKVSIIATWVFTILSGLSILSLYYSQLALLTLPIAFFFGYINLTGNKVNKGIYVPILLNLLLCGVLSSFIVSAGLWR